MNEKRSIEETMCEPTYRCERHYADEHAIEVVADGLTLKEAREICRDPETSSRTCTTKEGQARTEKYGPWFVSYTEE